MTTKRPTRRTSEPRKPGAGASRGRTRAEGAAPSKAARKATKGLGKAPKRGKGSGVKPTPPATAAVKARDDLAELRELAKAAIDAALEKKAVMPVLLDVSGMASYTDFIGVVSGRSDRQVEAISESITTAMKARGHQLLGREGSGNGRWTLLDFGAVVVHVFYHPVREFFDLESLWIDAPRVKLDIPPEAMLSQSDALYGAL